MVFKCSDRKLGKVGTASRCDLADGFEIFMDVLQPISDTLASFESTIEATKNLFTALACVKGRKFTGFTSGCCVRCVRIEPLNL